VRWSNKRMEHQDFKDVVFKKTQNIQRPPNPEGTAKFHKLNSDEPPVPEEMKKETCMAIQKARQAKKITQKDLAFLLNLQPKIINDYESGKAIPDCKIIRKMEKVLCVKLV
jgi:putative transcription factor